MYCQEAPVKSLYVFIIFNIPSLIVIFIIAVLSASQCMFPVGAQMTLNPASSDVLWLCSTS